MTKGGFNDLNVTAKDGLKLHLREYGDRQMAGFPVVCLPGLTRSTIDFHPLAYALANRAERPRRVLSLDYRGRGQSDYDPNPANYTVPIELEDVLNVMTACAAEPAVIVGTSRGGMIAMTMGAVRPTAIAGVVLNDIGPVVEMEGLLRIKEYVGKLPQPRDFADGADILRRLFAPNYPKFTERDWLASARRSWREENGKLVITYDPALADALAKLDPQTPLPELWPQFDALKDIPLLVIRGAVSDILSSKTVAEMKARRAQMEVLEVPDQGHAPLLVEPDVIDHIARFIDSCDRAP